MRIARFKLIIDLCKALPIKDSPLYIAHNLEINVRNFETEALLMRQEEKNYISWNFTRNKTIKDGDIAPWKDLKKELNKDKRKEQRNNYILI